MDKNNVCLSKNKTKVNLIEESIYQEKLKDLSVEKRLELMETRVITMEELITSLFSLKKGNKNAYQPEVMIKGTPELNKDGIPINMVFLGTTFGQSFLLTVHKFNYSIGNKTYETLSAAAEAVSGNRRSGWAFWKGMDGRTVKELFKS